jgi:hypothetical protein
MVVQDVDQSLLGAVPHGRVIDVFVAVPAQRQPIAGGADA